HADERGGTAIDEKRGARGAHVETGVEAPAAAEGVSAADKSNVHGRAIPPAQRWPARPPPVLQCGKARVFRRALGKRQSTGCTKSSSHLCVRGRGTGAVGGIVRRQAARACRRRRWSSSAR